MTDLNVAYWNIHGVGDKLRCENTQIFLRDYKIIVLAETWLGPNVDITLPGYIYHNFPRFKKHAKARRHAGGISIFVHESCNDGLSFVRSESDCFVWLKLEKSFFGFEQDIYICAAYIPPETSPFTKSLIYNPFDLLENEIAKYVDQGIVCIVGDCNAHTGQQLDYNVNVNGYESGESEMLYFVHSSYDTNHVTPRFSQDSHIPNNFRNALINLCIASDMRIMNGRLFQDKGIGVCTCMQGAGSLVDYLLCGNSMISYIENSNIEPFRAESDYRPLTFQLKCERIEYAIKGDSEIAPNKSTQFNWCNQDLSEFKSLVNASISQNKFASFQSCLENKEDV